MRMWSGCALSGHSAESCLPLQLLAPGAVYRHSLFCPLLFKDTCHLT
jgi:hypothetical protein